MKRFYLDRTIDTTGVSGVFSVADGVEFSDGTVVLRWRGPNGTTVIHDTMRSVETVHLHGGMTVIRWEDE